jgi:sulfur carrier protein ThiS
MIHTIARKGMTDGAPTIEITLKLFAMLERWLPEGAARNEIRVAVPAGTTPADIVAALDLPVALCAIVLVDGRFVEHEARATRALAAGESLSIWPPIAGG